MTDKNAAKDAKKAEVEAKKAEQQAAAEADAAKRKRRQKENSMQVKASSMAWLTTFADMMSLLMALFVILFALSEVDKEKFKMLGYSMKQAFGVPVPPMLQNNAKTKSVDPSTSHGDKSADQDARQKDDKRSNKVLPITPKKKTLMAKAPPAQDVHKASKDHSKTRADAKKIKAVFKQMMKNKSAEVIQKGDKIIVRLFGGDSFGSGSADLTPQVKAVLMKFSKKLKGIKGDVVVTGHTDDRPIASYRFRSNWELGAARAHSIITEMVEQKLVDPKRLSLRSYGATQTLAPNTNEKNRARNRRVEIMIDQSKLK